MVENSVLAQMERMLVENGIVRLDGDFVGKNMPAIDINDKGFWIMESTNGGTIRDWSVRRLRNIPMTVIYTLGVPVGSGTQILDEKTRQVCGIFKPNSESAEFRCEDCAVRVTELEVRSDYQNDTWYYRSIFIYLRVYAFAE